MWAGEYMILKKKSFLLSRDYVGQKPFFIVMTKKIWFFSSQINGIFKHKKVTTFLLKVKKTILDLIIPAPETLYKKYQVEPGEIFF